MPINIEIKGGRADIEHAALHITEGTGAEERTIVFSECAPTPFTASERHLAEG